MIAKLPSEVKCRKVVYHLRADIESVTYENRKHIIFKAKSGDFLDMLNETLEWIRDNKYIYAIPVLK